MFAIINLGLELITAEEFFSFVWLLTMAAVAIKSTCGFLHGERDYSVLATKTKLNVRRQRFTGKSKLLKADRKNDQEALVQAHLEDVTPEVIVKDVEAIMWESNTGRLMLETEQERSFFGESLTSAFARMPEKRSGLQAWALTGFSY